MAGTWIAGDWGTTSLRLFLCDGTRVLGPRVLGPRVLGPRVLDRRDGPGVAQVAGGAAGFAALIADLTAAWRAEGAVLPTLLGGMVGSTIGWVEVPYLDCPTGLDGLAAGLHRLGPAVPGLDIAIVPGLACVRDGGVPDVMRGEEVQIAGAIARDPRLTVGNHLLCLPGTHTKWAILTEGRIPAFRTALAGELYAVLRGHSVLLRGVAADAVPDDAAFADGMARAAAGTGLLHLLFETRARQLRGGMTGPAAASFLSGLIIGADVVDGLTLAPRGTPVTVIGAPALAALYARTLAHHGVNACVVDGGEASLAGLAALHTTLSTKTG
ncbi:MAG: hypothetical protein RLY86_999 [Pseudomonadota bacterium]|jgi:2-dehydro-3-deoxygalactonokinase